MDANLEKPLREWFRPLSGTLTAFSGGIDSALVLFLSRKFLGPERAIGVISNSESLKDRDYSLALGFAKKNDIRLKTIHTAELEDPNYNSNPSNRCFHCKTHLYTALDTMRSKFPGYTVLNGTNKDDFSDYRPGLKAAEAHGVRSPLAELGLDKAQVRRLAKKYGIPFWNKPASPCLSSRIPYGSRVTADKLAQIQAVEELLGKYGFEEVRARHLDSVCSLEVPLAAVTRLQGLLPQLEPEIRNLGFAHVNVDSEGLVSGKLNRMLTIPNG